MTPDKIFVTLVGLAAIGFIVWFFWMVKRTGVKAALGSSGYQEVMVLVKGGYTPDVIIVEEREKFTGTGPDPRIARRGDSGVLPVDHAGARQLTCESLKLVRRIRAIVDQDEPPIAVTLIAHRCERHRQIPAHPIRRHNNVDVAEPHRAASREDRLSTAAARMLARMPAVVPTISTPARRNPPRIPRAFALSPRRRGSPSDRKPLTRSPPAWATVVAR